MSINTFLSTIAKNGGMSFSNNFIVKFENTPVSVDDELVEFFCDEAQLPNINTATGSINGLYTGLGNVDYPHTKVFTELQLGFMLDSNLTLLKFLNDWYESIFVETGGTSENRVVRLNYKKDYAAKIKITKSEIGPSSTTQRQPITYVLEEAYPYAIDAIPLQFGSSQITKVTAQFKYQRHYTIDNDITNVKDSIIPSGGVLVGEVNIGPGVYKQQWLLPNGRIVEKQGNKVGTGTLP